MRKLIDGIGINDADYVTSPTINGKQVKCVIYATWSGMINRCYSAKSHAKRPAYIDCSVCNEWLLFSNFRKWMIKQDWKGMEIDKDIITPGNRVYSPENCYFIPSGLNKLLTGGTLKKHSLPIGVTLVEDTGMYRVRLRYSGVKTQIGNFKCKIEARNAYIIAKSNLIIKISSEQCDIRVSEGLISHAKILLSGIK